AKHEEHHPPAVRDQQAAGRERCDGDRETAEEVRDTLYASALGRREPQLHTAARHRKRAGLGDAEEKPRGEEGPESNRSAGENRARGRGGDEHREPPFWPEPIAEPADRDLADRIRPGERGEDEAHLVETQSEVSPHFGLRDRDDAPIEIADQVHQAEEAEHPPARARRAGCTDGDSSRRSGRCPHRAKPKTHTPNPKPQEIPNAL